MKCLFCQTRLIREAVGSWMYQCSNCPLSVIYSNFNLDEEISWYYIIPDWEKNQLFEWYFFIKNDVISTPKFSEIWTRRGRLITFDHLPKVNPSNAENKLRTVLTFL